MNPIQPILAVLIALFISGSSFSQNDKTEVLRVVNAFFQTMESKDDVGFNALFLESAYAYSVRQKADSVIVRNAILKAISSKNILKERLRAEEIIIHVANKVAAVWAPYDFWINDTHSHCGHEVFTLIKKDQGWKIASLTYSVEKDSCNY